MVFWKNVFPDSRHYVVPVDIPEITDWPAIKPGVEIFITDQYDQFIIGDTDGHHGLAFLETPLNLSANWRKT